MNYFDLHCDTLTACPEGQTLESCDLQINLKKLHESGCAAQCFAIFTQGEDAALRVEKTLAFFEKSVSEFHLRRILSAADLKECLRTGATGAVLTVENLGFIGNDLSAVKRLAQRGVKMASLVWNEENGLAVPNVKFKGGIPLFSERESRGLKALGRQVVELLDECGILIDLSHLSDGGAEEILTRRRRPVVASHSNAAAVCGVSRNLTDEQIRKIADCGGVIGINFCRDFLGDGAAFSCVRAHLTHMIGTGGEDVVAFGSDFDGIPPTSGLEDCSAMPALIEDLERHGFSARILEKLCYRNFLRVFREVCG